MVCGLNRDTSSSAGSVAAKPSPKPTTAVGPVMSASRTVEIVPPGEIFRIRPSSRSAIQSEPSGPRSRPETKPKRASVAGPLSP